MKKLFYSSAIISLAFLLSCSSPLSDTPVSDPGLITPSISIVHTDDDYGVSNTVGVCLTDKNGAYIELMEGNIKINDDLMEFGMTCYKRSIDVKGDKKYEVMITLADSTEYPFAVTTPSFFKKVDFPNKIKKNETFDVSWKSEGSAETTVSFAIRDTSNNLVILFEEVTSNNYATIDPDNFPKYNVDEGTVTLFRKSKGTMPDGFNGGSIQANCIFERTIKIK